MPTSTKVKNLNINELTEAQYDAAVQGGVIGANELSVLTDVEYVEPSDLATVATTGDYSDLINRPTNLVSTNTAQTISGMKTFSGDITLSGTTSIKNNTGGTNYTMLYRDASTIHVGASTSALKLEGSGTRPAYNNDSLALLSDVTGGLPDQTGNAGKFLTTDGTDATWGTTVEDNTLVIKNSQTSMYGGYPNQITLYSKYNGSDGTGASIKSGNNGSMVLNASSISTTGGIYPSGYVGLNLGLDTSSGTWNTVYARNLGNRSSSYVISIPEATAGVLAVQVSTMPTAGGTRVGQIYQYVGTTDANYTNGYFYKCVSDGQTPATYSWEEVSFGGGAVASGMTLMAADWSNNTQTVLITGVTSSSIVFVAPYPSDTAAYTAAGILCTAQGQDSLTFICTTTPTVDVAVNIVVML